MGKKILFQGDSVTDVGRMEEQTGFLGRGYPAIIAGKLKETGSSDTVVNRAIGGDRVIDLWNRWEKDCLAVRPDVLSLLVGINDCWWKHDGVHVGTPMELFREKYDSLLSQAVGQNPNLVLILMEPFVLPYPPDRKTWRETLDPIIHSVREFAAKYHARLVPLDGIMNAAAIEYGCEKICNPEDGVHPTPLGQQIIADAWMKTYASL